MQCSLRSCRRPARSMRRSTRSEACPPSRGRVPVRTRIGLHTGEALLVGDDYVGTTVHCAARVTAAAHGGQIVASDACRSLAPDASWTDLGRHRLKDIDRPQRLHQLDTGTTRSSRRCRPPTTCRPTSPSPLDTFVGRDDERRVPGRRARPVAPRDPRGPGWGRQDAAGHRDRPHRSGPLPRWRPPGRARQGVRRRERRSGGGSDVGGGRSTWSGPRGDRRQRGGRGRRRCSCSTTAST